IAFSRMAGLAVTPLSPSSSMIRFSSPELSIARRNASSQMLCPNASSRRSGLSAISAFYHHDLLQGVDWLGQLRLRLHDLLDGLVASGALVDDVRVRPALDPLQR